MLLGEQREQRRFVTGCGVGEPPPSERKVHPLGMKQRQPVLSQRGIGMIIVRLVSTQPELGALSAKQVPAVLRREAAMTSVAIATACSRSADSRGSSASAR